jgi:hypothetical protein
MTQEEGSMDNAIVVVSNDMPSPKAKKFWVEFNVNFGNHKCALANQVFFKDGLVLMEGVIGIVSLNSKVTPVDHISWRDGWSDKRWKGPMRVCGMAGPKSGWVEYGREYASLVVDRSNVGRVEGITVVEDLNMPWFRTKDEAQKMADDEQIKINALARKDNTEMVDTIADWRRKERAYMSWKALPWPIRVFTPNKWYINKFPSSIDDRAWVVTQADKLKLDYGA